MLIISVVCITICLLVFVCRERIFSCIGSAIYRMAQKSVESCDGRVSLDSTVVSQSATNKTVEFPKVPHAQANGLGFMINVRSVGQGFDLNAKRNARFCTPTSEQDLFPGNDLA